LASVSAWQTWIDGACLRLNIGLCPGDACDFWNARAQTGTCAVHESGQAGCERDASRHQTDYDYFWPSLEIQLNGGWFTWWDLGHYQGFPDAGEWEWFEDEWPRAEWRKHRYHRRKAWKRGSCPKGAKRRDNY
jgi:hypothetical protein